MQRDQPSQPAADRPRIETDSGESGSRWWLKLPSSVFLGVLLVALAVVAVPVVYHSFAPDPTVTTAEPEIERLEPLPGEVIEADRTLLEPDLQVVDKIRHEPEISTFNDTSAAPISVELSEAGLDHAHEENLLNTIASTGSTTAGFEGRGQAARRQMVAHGGGSAQGGQAQGNRHLPLYRRTAADDEFAALPVAGNSPDEGQGPGQGGNQFDRITDNPFKQVANDPLSTFSIDVDTASYSLVRSYLQASRYPPADAVRIEEFVNYFDYDYAPPRNDDPFAAHVEVADCPWRDGHQLLRIGLKGKVIENEQRPPSNLVFLIDVSGSMSEPNKLPLLKQSLKLLLDVLRKEDRVAMVVYAGAAGQVLPSTPADRRSDIDAALDKLHAGGSTAGAAGIELAYQVARKHFLRQGTNRVILCTDGDFNVGLTSSGGLERLIEEQAKSGVFLSIMGFGMGNYQDGRMEQLSGKGNGNYGYIDDLREARKVFVSQLAGTLVTIAKDVKIQIEFNPAEVGAYRLIGYENRLLAAQDFNDDKKDAGEIGAGHTVTALYELVPPGKLKDLKTPGVDKLKYQRVRPSKAAAAGELLTLKLRYKQPDGETSRLLTFPVANDPLPFARASRDFQFASSVAAFGMLLRNSEHRGGATFGFVKEVATSTQGGDPHGYRAQFVELVTQARGIVGQP